MILLAFDDVSKAKNILKQIKALRERYNKTTSVPVILINYSAQPLSNDLEGNIIATIPCPFGEDKFSVVSYMNNKHQEYCHQLAFTAFKVYLDYRNTYRSRNEFTLIL